MNYILLKITYESISMEIIDKCPSYTYLAKREQKEHCTFKLCNSKEAVIAYVMQLALNKATETKNMLQDVLSIVTQLKKD